MRLGIITLLAGGLLALTGSMTEVAAAPAPAPASDPLASQLQQQLAQQAALSATVASLTAEVAAADQSQQQLRDLVAANQVAIQETVGRLRAAEQRYQDATAREARARAAEAEALLRERQDKRLLGVYLRLGYMRHDDLASYVLSSTSMSDLFSRAADLSRMVHASTELVAQIARDVAAAQRAAQEAQKEAAAAQQAALQLQGQQQTLADQTTRARQLIAQLGAQAAATAAEIGAVNSQTLAVAQQIAQTRLAELDQAIAQAEQAAWQAAEYWLQNHVGTLPPSIAQPPTAPIAADGTQLTWPTRAPSVTQGFGPSPYPFEPPAAGYPHFHTGIDLAGREGDPLTAAADGVVVAADQSTVGYGNHLIIAHAGGLLTLYGHLSVLLVKAGDTVTRGQTVGLMGSTGNSTGPHCHFEVRVNQQPVDPLPFLPKVTPAAVGG